MSRGSGEDLSRELALAHERAGPVWLSLEVADSVAAEQPTELAAARVLPGIVPA